MKRIKNWFRFIFDGPAIIARVWKRQKELRETLEKQAEEIAALKSAVAGMQVAAYRPPEAVKQEKPVIRCRTMKEFNDIREREMEEAGI